MKYQLVDHDDGDRKYLLDWQEQEPPSEDQIADILAEGRKQNKPAPLPAPVAQQPELGEHQPPSGTSIFDIATPVPKQEQAPKVPLAGSGLFNTQPSEATQVALKAPAEYADIDQSLAGAVPFSERPLEQQIAEEYKQPSLKVPKQVQNQYQVKGTAPGSIEWYDKLPDEHKEAIDPYLSDIDKAKIDDLQQNVAQGALKSAVNAASYGALNKESAALLQVRHPNISMAAQMVGTLADFIPEGAAVHLAVQLPRVVARAKSYGRVGGAIANAVTVGTTMGLDATIRNRDRLSSPDPVVRDQAEKEILQQVEYGLVAIVPSMAKLSGWKNRVSQAVISLLFSAKDDPDAFKKENIVQTMQAAVTMAIIAGKGYKSKTSTPKLNESIQQPVVDRPIEMPVEEFDLSRYAPKTEGKEVVDYGKKEKGQEGQIPETDVMSGTEKKEEVPGDGSTPALTPEQQTQIDELKKQYAPPPPVDPNKPPPTKDDLLFQKNQNEIDNLKNLGYIYDEGKKKYVAADPGTVEKYWSEFGRLRRGLTQPTPSDQEVRAKSRSLKREAAPESKPSEGTPAEPVAEAPQPGSETGGGTAATGPRGGGESPLVTPETPERIPRQAPTWSGNHEVDRVAWTTQLKSDLRDRILKQPGGKQQLDYVMGRVTRDKNNRPIHYTNHTKDVLQKIYDYYETSEGKDEALKIFGTRENPFSDFEDVGAVAQEGKTKREAEKLLRKEKKNPTDPSDPTAGMTEEELQEYERYMRQRDEEAGSNKVDLGDGDVAFALTMKEGKNLPPGLRDAAQLGVAYEKKWPDLNGWEAVQIANREHPGKIEKSKHLEVFLDAFNGSRKGMALSPRVPNAPHAWKIHEIVRNAVNNPKSMVAGGGGQMSLFAKQDPMGFYSNAEKAVESIKMPKAPADQWLKMLDPAKGVGAKSDEMKWLGLDDFLKEKGNQSVSKQEIQDFIEQNKVKLEEVKKGQKERRDLNIVRNQENPILYDVVDDNGNVIKRGLSQSSASDYIGNYWEGMGETKFQSYQLPGGENYREMLLMLPNDGEKSRLSAISKWNALRDKVRTRLNKPVQNLIDANDQGLLTPEEKQQFDMVSKEHDAAHKKLGLNYKSSHWDEPNVLAHVRLNDRTDADGKKVLFVEEIQSDWHQEGRKRGYKSKDLPLGFRIVEQKNGTWVVYNEENSIVVAPQRGTKQEVIDRYYAGTRAVPAAPFSKTWHELAFKRILREAAEKGYDKVAWTTGEQQAERYDLSKQISAIRYHKNSDGSFNLKGVDKSARQIDVADSIQENKLADYIGKDLADRIIKGEGQKVYFLAGDWKQFSGADLKVGGEGMKGFYDKILVDYANKYGKKWGAKVGELTLNAPYEPKIGEVSRNKNYLHDKEPLASHSIDITPAMRESVMREGQPMFAKGKEDTPETAQAHINTVQGWADKTFGRGLIRVVNGPEGFTKATKDKIKAKGFEGQVVAVYDGSDSHLYIDGSQIRSQKELIKYGKHELTHLGLRVSLGEKQLLSVYETLYGKYKNSEIGKDIVKNYFPDGFHPEEYYNHKITFVDEVLAKLGEGNIDPGFFRRMVARIKVMLNARFPGMKFTDTDVRAMIANGHRAAERFGKKLGELPEGHTLQYDADTKKWAVLNEKGETVNEDTDREKAIAFATKGQPTPEDERIAKEGIGDLTPEKGKAIADKLGMEFDGFQEGVPQAGVPHRYQFTDPKTGSSITAENEERAAKLRDDGREKFAKEKPVNQTETPEFKRWFGDSKVVDEKGKPLVVTSGHMNAEMYGTKYDPKKSTAGGFYATEDPAIASNYAKGKFGSKEYFERGSQYRVRGKNGKYNKKLWQVELTDDQLKKLEELKNKKDENGNYDYDIGEMDNYIKEHKDYDKDARRWSHTGGSKSLQNIYEFYEQMGYTISHRKEVAPGEEYNPVEQIQQSRFDDLLDALKIDYNSFEKIQPGVMPLYLSIKNPLDASKPFPKDLLEELKKASKYERNVPDQYGVTSTNWTKEYPLKQWVKDIESGYQYWTTQIPKKALPIIEKFGYDGIKELGMKGTTEQSKRQVNWIAFRPEQIKSAIGNRGTFDPDNPDIRFALKGEEEGAAGEVEVSDAQKIEDREYMEGLYRQNLKQGKLIVDRKLNIGQSLEKVLTPISSRLGRINPQLKTAIREFEYDTAQLRKKWHEQAIGWLKDKRKMGSDDKRTLDLAEKNRDSVKIDELVKKYGLEKQYEAKRKMLDNIYEEAKLADLDIRYLSKYSPRIIADKEGFLSSLKGGENWSVIREAVEAKTKAEKRPLTSDEIADIANKLLQGYSIEGITLYRPGSTKERKIGIITPQLNRYYKNSDSALMTYIEQLSDAISARKFFKGYLQIEDGKINIDKTIGAYVGKLAIEGKIDYKQEKEVSDILRARFNQKPINRALGLFRNLSYIDTMGSPYSAITQLQDHAFAMYHGGIFNTIDTIFRKKKISINDIGIDKIAIEFTDPSKSAEVLAKIFKMVGFDRMDRLGKEVLINSAFKKYQSMARSGSPKLLKKLQPILGPERSVSAINDFKNGKVSEDVKFILFSDLLDFQPVAMSEMPEVYLKSGASRLLYMLKTYTIKQLDVFRRNIIDEYKVDSRQAIINAVRLSGMLVALGMTTDAVRDFLSGRKTYLDDLTTDNLLKLVGLTKYITVQARQEGIPYAATKMVSPPFQLIESIGKDTDKALRGKIDSMDKIKDLEILKSVPVVGKMYYWWLGGGKTKEEKSIERHSDYAKASKLIHHDKKAQKYAVYSEYNKKMHDINEKIKKAEKKGNNELVKILKEKRNKISTIFIGNFNRIQNNKKEVVSEPVRTPDDIQPDVNAGAPDNRP